MDTIHSLSLHLPSFTAGVILSGIITAIVLLIEKSRQ